ncbi:MAG: hypothetical protein NXH90_11110 [Flavobacteriaceae bacterium]|nr:hypothetical protein [Flavobacteriaceae bacterium]
MVVEDSLNIAEELEMDCSPLWTSMNVNGSKLWKMGESAGGSSIFGDFPSMATFPIKMEKGFVYIGFSE